jgi:polyvinyl alcohol dehydrogenase (cytochrome)
MALMDLIVRRARWRGALFAALLVAPLAFGATAFGAKGWIVYGHDLSNTRFNGQERRINRRTARRLSPGWEIDGLVGVTGTPVVAKDVAYFGDWTGAARAVDAKTGTEIWHTQVGGVVVGAPAVEGDAVYVSSGATLRRLDRATGAIEWSTVANEHPLAQINASPVVVDGLVLQGVASFEVTIPAADYTFRGTIGAYDAETGAEIWRFYATPGDAENGAGVGIWSTPAVDRKRGLLYVGSGNTYEQPTAALADSILAIDYRTGQLAWSTQFTYPDVFSAGHPEGKDADVGASPNLWRSKGRALVGAGDKAGVYYALDRDTGQIVWQTPLTPGGLFGGEIGSAALVDGKLITVSNHGAEGVARIFALDPDTGGVLWEADPFPGRIFAPVGAVRGVAFVGTDAGTLAALDTRTGDLLWRHTAPARTGCGPSIVDGRVLWGYGFTLFSGPGAGGVLSFVVGQKIQ